MYCNVFRYQVELTINHCRSEYKLRSIYSGFNGSEISA